MANHLVEHTNEGELLAWFLSSQTRQLVQHAEEPQVQELISVLHRQAPSSGLLLESVASRWDSLLLAASPSSPSRSLGRVLDCIRGTHRAHTGRLLQLLVGRCLQQPRLALGRTAHAEACQRAELLLSETEEFVRDQLAAPDLAHMLATLAAGRRPAGGQQRCYGRLIGLLNRLAVSFYDLSPVEMGVEGGGRKFSPGTICSVELDKAWFVGQVKRLCCSPAASPRECARLLANLRFSDIMLIVTAKDFNLRILEECLVQGVSLPDVRGAASIDSLDRLSGLLSDPERSPGLREAAAAANNGPHHQLKEGPPLYRAASQVLLQHIKNVIELLPRPPQVYRPEAWWQPSASESRYSHRLDDFFSRPETRHLIVQLLPAFSRLLATYTLLPGRRRPPSLPPHAVLEMARFGVLAMELVKWLVAGSRETVLPPGTQHMVMACLEVAGVTLANPHMAATLALPANNLLACSAVLAMTDYLRIRPEGSLRLPEYPFPTVAEQLQSPNPPPLLVGAACLARLLMHYEATSTVTAEDEGKSSGAAGYLEDKIFNIVIGLARLPQFSSLARAPPLAFSLGWRPDLVVEQQVLLGTTTVPSSLLQEQDVLQQLIWRLNSLGWTGRAQFEETWMCLLSVLNVSAHQEDFTNEEVSALAQSTAAVVGALVSLLVATLGLPVAGIPGAARLLHHPRDTPNAFLLTGRGQQLTAIQNIVHQRLADAAASHAAATGRLATVGLPVDSSVNLERAFISSSGNNGGYSPVPATRYGLGQVSLGYIHTCLAYHEDGSSPEQDRASLASSAALPLFLLIREENLAAAGLDTHSCVQFVIDLFSQWLAVPGGQDTPLGVLTAAVRAITMISDIFTQMHQFTWMLASLSDLQKVHPPEDELMAALFCVGMAKAVAVTGRLEPELWDRLRKMLETGLRSQNAFARTAATHGLLYLLQADFGPDAAGGLLGLAVDHIKSQLWAGRGTANLSLEDGALVTWSLLFYLLENYHNELAATATGHDHQTDVAASFVQLALVAAGQADLARPVYSCLLAGLERLVVAGRVGGRQLDLVVKLATDLMTEWAPVSVLPAVQLFLGRKLPYFLR
jgi:huntingtin